MSAETRRAGDPELTGLLPDAVLASNCGKRIGILIVAYNAVSTLVPVLRRISPLVWDSVEEVVVFDDASADATYELAVGYKTLAHSEKLNIVKHPKNLRYGGNQKAGYAYFMEKGFDVVVLLHGDGQYAPEVLSHLYHPIVAGEADAVLGSRMMKDFGGPLKGGMPLYKYVGNRILTTYENRSLGMDLTEFHSGFRAYSLSALRKIDLSKMTDDFHFDTEILIKLNHQGMRIKEVPIPTYYGDEICHVNGMTYAADVARAVRRYKACARSVKRYPEFEEYFVHYPFKGGKYSSHFYFLELTGVNEDVLDVGCGEGFLASKLAERNNRVTGIDLIPAPRLREAFANYVSADVGGGLGALRAAAPEARFDKILLMDVLEHLPTPETLLRECIPLLRDGGQIVVSVPNVANVTVRAALLAGRFDYTERGILDRTHLRFFTRRTVRRLLAQSGLEIVKERVTVMPIELVLGVPPKHPIMRGLTALLASLTRLFPTVLGYQFVFAVRPRAAGR